MRSIEKDMIRWLDGKLKNNGLAQKAIEEKLPRILMVEAAKACVGIREVGGNNQGPMVELMQKTIGSAGREPWCVSFVMTCIAYAEVKTGVPSPIFPTEHVVTMWTQTNKTQRVKRHPLAGAIVCWRYGNSASGHTGIILDCDEKIFNACEGNTESGIEGGNVVREGGGVYLTTRNRYGTGNMKVLGFLKPW